MFYNRKNCYYQNYPYLNNPYTEEQLQAYREAVLDAHVKNRVNDGVSFVGGSRVDSPGGTQTFGNAPPNTRDFIPYGYVSRPGSTPNSYSLWGGSGGSESQSDSSYRKYFSRALCRVLMGCSVLLVVLAVLGIVGIAVYLGYISMNEEEYVENDYIENFVGTLGVLQGDSWVPDLSFPESAPFRAKATKYSNMFRNVFRKSILGPPFSGAEILHFRVLEEGIFELSFKLSLDRRKLPKHLPDTKGAVREIMLQELRSISPVSFHNVKVDLNSLKLSREMERRPTPMPLPSIESDPIEDFRVFPVNGADVVVKKKQPNERFFLRGQVSNVNVEGIRKPIPIHLLPPQGTSSATPPSPPTKPTTTPTTTSSTTSTTSSTTSTMTPVTTPSTTTTSTTTTPTTVKPTTSSTTSSTTTSTTTTAATTTTTMSSSTLSTKPTTASSTVSNLVYEFGPWRPVHPNDALEQTTESSSGKNNNIRRFLELLAEIASFSRPGLNPIKVVDPPNNMTKPSNTAADSFSENKEITPLALRPTASTTESIVISTTTQQTSDLDVVRRPSVLRREGISKGNDNTLSQHELLTRFGSPYISDSHISNHRNEVEDTKPPSKQDIRYILSHLLFLTTTTARPILERENIKHVPYDLSEYSGKSELREDDRPETYITPALSNNGNVNSKSPLPYVTSYSGVRDVKRPLPIQNGVLPLDRFRHQAVNKSTTPTPTTIKTTSPLTFLNFWNFLTTNKPLILDTEVVTSTSYDINYGFTRQPRPIYIHSTLTRDNLLKNLRNQDYLSNINIPVISKDSVRYITVNRTRDIYPKVVIVNLPASETSRESKDMKLNKQYLKDILDSFSSVVDKNEYFDNEKTTMEPEKDESEHSLWSLLSSLKNLPFFNPSTIELLNLHATEDKTSWPDSNPSHGHFNKESLNTNNNSHELSSPASNISKLKEKRKQDKSLKSEQITAVFVREGRNNNGMDVVSITSRTPAIPGTPTRENSPIHTFTFNEGQSLEGLLHQIFDTLRQDDKRTQDFRTQSKSSFNKAINLEHPIAAPLEDDTLMLIESISNILTGNYDKFNMLLEDGGMDETDFTIHTTQRYPLNTPPMGNITADSNDSENYIGSGENNEQINNPVKNYSLELFPVITRPLNAISTTTPITIIDIEHQDNTSTTVHPFKVVTSMEVSYSVHSGSSNYPEQTDADGNTECTEDQFKCSNGRCISKLARCNMVRDCTDGEDEKPCSCADFLRSQQYTRKICDGIIDCWDKSDELNCEWCYPGHFICTGIQKCVPPENVCDGYPDCPNGDDERSCVTIAPNSIKANGLDYFDEGFLMVRRKGIWGKLCVDNFESAVAKAGVMWSVTDLGEAVCDTLTFDSFDGIQRLEDTVPPTSRSVETQYYEIDVTRDVSYPPRGRGPPISGTAVRSLREKRNVGCQANEITIGDILTKRERTKRDSVDSRLSLKFREAQCKKRDVVKVKCDGLQCGVRPRATTQQARIVGGSNSSPGAWPWHAALYKEGEYQCGATLISNYFLISAGHCFYSAKSEYWVARLGALRRGTKFPSPFEQLRTISHIFIHPDYVNQGYIHDISVLRMEQPVSFSDYVRPVCLPSQGDEVNDGERCTLVGWGQLFEVKKIFPDTLQEVEVPLISTKECRKQTIFLPLYRITDNMFCAGYDRGGRDACLGDSGGPLMCQKTDGRWVAMGVTSNGYGCARPRRPGVYTKIGNYLSWIEHIIEISQSDLVVPITKKCDGRRCPLGQCLPHESVCNGRIECSDGSDEIFCPTRGR